MQSAPKKLDKPGQTRRVWITVMLSVSRCYGTDDVNCSILQCSCFT